MPRQLLGSALRGTSAVLSRRRLPFALALAAIVVGVAALATPLGAAPSSKPSTTSPRGTDLNDPHFRREAEQVLAKDAERRSRKSRPSRRREPARPTPIGMSASLAQQALINRRQEDRDSVEAREARRRSRTAYRSKRHRDAFEVGRRAFGEAIDRPAFEPLELERGEKVASYTSPATAVIEEASPDGGRDVRLANQGLRCVRRSTLESSLRSTSAWSVEALASRPGTLQSRRR